MKKFEYLGTNKNGQVELFVNERFFSFDKDDSEAFLYPLENEALSIQNLTDVATGRRLDIDIFYKDNGKKMKIVFSVDCIFSTILEASYSNVSYMIDNLQIRKAKSELAKNFIDVDTILKNWEADFYLNN